MSEELKERKYGKYGWISITDKSYDPVEDEKITWPSRKEVVKREEYTKEIGQSKTTQRRMRERWRALFQQHQKKGIDSLPWDVYSEMWEKAGKVEILEGLEVWAPRLQRKFWCQEFRTMMVQINPLSGKGFTKGNVAVIAVEGVFRNPHKQALPKDIYVLSLWGESDEIVKVERGSDLDQRVTDCLLEADY